MGRALVGEVAAWAGSVGLEAVRLHVTRGNEPARRLYEAMGFAATGDWMRHPRYEELVEDEMELALVAADRRRGLGGK